MRVVDYLIKFTLIIGGALGARYAGATAGETVIVLLLIMIYLDMPTVR